MRRAGFAACRSVSAAPYSSLQTLVGEVTRRCMTRAEAHRHVVTWAKAHVGEAERERFTAMAEAELLGVRESNFARYRVRPSEYHAWKIVWAR